MKNLKDVLNITCKVIVAIVEVNVCPDECMTGWWYHYALHSN